MFVLMIWNHEMADRQLSVNVLFIEFFGRKFSIKFYEFFLKNRLQVLKVSTQ